MSTFEAGIWIPGLDSHKAKTGAANNAPGAPQESERSSNVTATNMDDSASVKPTSTTSLSRRKSFTEEMLESITSSLSRKKSVASLSNNNDDAASLRSRKPAQILYQIFNLAFDNTPAPVKATGHDVFVRSHKFSTESDFESDDDFGSSDSEFTGSNNYLHQHQNQNQTHHGSPSRPVTPASSVPRLTSHGSSLFQSRRGSHAPSVSGADSDSDSDFDGPAKSSRRESRRGSLMSFKNLLGGGKHPSHPAPAPLSQHPHARTSGSAAAIFSETGKSPGRGKQERGGSTGEMRGRRGSVDSGTNSSDSENGGQAGTGSSQKSNLFKNIMNGKRRATTTSTVSGDNLSRASSKNQLGNNTGDVTPGASLKRSDSETSLSEKYGPTSKKELGRGVSAIVRLCSPVNSDKKFAIKEFIPRRKEEIQKEYIKKVMSEFCISSSLVHENIIKTIDLIQDEKRKWCLVMEYAEGGSLFPKICGGLLSDPDVINCFLKQLIRGVAYLHSMGVAHRDLKPENLLLDKSNRILKITDFGVSDVFRAPFQSLARKAAGECGSGPYIAPEIFLEKEYNAELVDVWSIGVIYYAMLYRSAPWKISKSSDARFKTYQDNQEGFWNVYRMVAPPHNVRKLLYRILEIEPSKRITSSDLIEDEWVASVEACESGMPAEATAHSHASLACA
ncbi:hypothetical protein CcCBS67573_g04032 [Chytriomyces confervae]|uniref:non-specific serine/threonine protein kinase n=1 Tax=Chytriomyces confervae TaxID=246404 RepID=A0A507FH75_9FUNG|nr:hypothetical protein CcCBS67573_g04032 [Chytriomyces confervae]